MAENIRQDTDKNKQGFDRQYDKGKTSQTDKRATGNVERRDDRQGSSGGMGRNDYPSKEIGGQQRDTDIGGRGMEKDVDKDLDLNKDSDFESRGAA